MESTKKYGIIYISIGVVIMLLRIVVIGHYQVTGEKMVSEIFIIVGFWLSIILLGLGITLYMYGRKVS